MTLTLNCFPGIIDRRKCLSLPSWIYLLKFNNRNTRARCEICSKLTIKSRERRHSSSYRNQSFNLLVIVNFEHFSHFALVCFYC